MARMVIKRDGMKQPFDADKIKKSIQTAAEDADLERDRVDELVTRTSQEVLEFAAGVEEISTSDLRDKILGLLETAEPLAADAWHRYEEANK